MGEGEGREGRKRGKISLTTDGHLKNCNYTFERAEKFLVGFSLSFELSTMDDNRLSSRRWLYSIRNGGCKHISIRSLQEEHDTL